MPDQADYIDLTHASKFFPGDPQTSAIWRWCRKGCIARSGERVYLEHVRSGGKLYTTKAWCAEYLAKLAAMDMTYFKSQQQPVDQGTVWVGSTVQPIPTPFTLSRRPRTAQQREAAIRRAKAEVASWSRKTFHRRP